MKKYCCQCGSVDRTKTITKGSILIELAPSPLSRRKLTLKDSAATLRTNPIYVTSERLTLVMDYKQIRRAPFLSAVISALILSLVGCKHRDAANSTDSGQKAEPVL